jgi:hypothetical protein
MTLLRKQDKKIFRQNIIFEVDDYRSEECVVTCFKKICQKNQNLRMNCFVTQFSFTRNDDSEPSTKVDDTLQNCEKILNNITQAAKQSED